MILDDILAHKRDEVAARRRATGLDALRARPLYREPRRGFRLALARAAAPAVIAEVKRASPSLARYDRSTRRTFGVNESASVMCSSTWAFAIVGGVRSGSTSV